MPRPRTSTRVALLATTLLAAFVTAVPATATAASATLAPASKQALTINIGTYPTTFDPSRAVDRHDDVVLHALFAPLYRNPGGSAGAITPFLAAKAPVVSNGGLRYTVTLRAATWSDGTPITAADVKVAYTRARSTERGRAFDAVRAVTAIGGRTVVFDLMRPVPWFDELLASSVVTPIPAKQVARYGSKWVQQSKLVSSGPFVLTNHRGAYDVQLAPNPRWWGSTGTRLTKLTLVAVPPASAGTLFDAGRIDATLRETSVLDSNLERRLTDPRTHQVGTREAHVLWINTTVPALASPATRRGIALAIDRAQLARATSLGVDRPLRTIVPSGMRGSGAIEAGSSPLLSASGAADPSAARAQLAAGGFDATQTLDLWFASTTTDVAVASRLRDDLAAVGVRVALHAALASDLAKLGLGVSPVRADVDLVLLPITADLGDAQSMHELLSCAAVSAGDNLANFCDAGYDAALVAATSFRPFAGRVAAMQGLARLVTGTEGAFPVVPLYEHRGTYLVQPWVRGFTHQTSGLVDFERLAALVH